MVNKVPPRFEAQPSSQYPVTEMRPRGVAEVVDTVLSTMVQVGGLPFVEKEGFIGLREMMNNLLERSVPRCDAEPCGLSAELRGVSGGIGDETVLSVHCPRIQAMSRADAQAAETRCGRQHLRTAKWFGDWIRELAQSIEVAEENRTAARQAADEADSRLRDLVQ